MAEPVQNVHGGKLLAKLKAGVAGAGVAAVAIMIMMFVPLVPIAAEEEYQEMQTRTVSEQVMEPRQDELFSQEDYTIQPGDRFRTTARVDAGQEVEVAVSASDTVDTYVRTSMGILIHSREDVSSANYRFTAPIDDVYTFEVVNPHNGVLGLGSKTVGLYSASATASWEEPVTKTREVTEPVTEKRMVTKNVTVMEMITGMVRVPSIG